MSLLNITSLTYREKSKVILSDISFKIDNGNILTLLGPSGSGKTSLLRLISGLSRPSSGQIILDGEVLSNKSFVLASGKRKVGLMFQENVLFPHLTVKDNIEFGLKSKNVKSNDIADQLINRFNLQDISSSYPEKLSGGEQQRVALARALAPKPKLMLLDEPFSSLDNHLRSDVCDFTIGELKKDFITTIMVTHDAEEAMRVSDYIVIIDKGEMLGIGKPKDVYLFPKNLICARMLGPTIEFKDKIINNSINTPFGSITVNNIPNGIKATALLRPENIIISNEGVNAKILDIHFMGKYSLVRIFFNKKWPEFNIYTLRKDLIKGTEIKVSVDLSLIAVLTS